MAGFRKAKAEQAALKVGLYGLAGSGKTMTALMCAEGLAKLTKKRVAFVDTERGTDFYCQAEKSRNVHPEAFDFDALYTKSITEIMEAVKSLDSATYSVVVIDSITHVWEAARLAYAGKETKIGTIPFHAWAKIKKPYKELVAFLLSSPLHVFFCGRQGNEFAEDEESGETKKVGIKMKAEGETPYEPHILIHMESVRDMKNGTATITAFAEKDRTGVLAGRVIQNPNFDSLVKPLLHLLGDKQAKVQTDDEVGQVDAERFADEDAKREETSAALFKEFCAKLDLCKTKADVEVIGKAITPEVKKQMTTGHVGELREKYKAVESAMKG